MSAILSTPSINTVKLRENLRQLQAGLIAPSREHVTEEVLTDHSADPIKSMDDIKSITISGDEENGNQWYFRKYTYDRTTGAYTGKESGGPIEAQGSNGGDLQFYDLDTCTIVSD